MNFEMLTARAEIMLRTWQESGRVRDGTYITIHVASDGHVELPYMAGGEDHRKALDILHDEWEVITWRRIGPEDSEPFLTEEWMERTAELRAALSQGGVSGWIGLDLPEPLRARTAPAETT